MLYVSRIRETREARKWDIIYSDILKYLKLYALGQFQYET